MKKGLMFFASNPYLSCGVGRFRIEIASLICCKKIFYFRNLKDNLFEKSSQQFLHHNFLQRTSIFFQCLQTCTDGVFRVKSKIQ